MSEYVLEAELRETTGKGAARRMRRAGKMPAIIYGGDKPDLPITLEYLAVSKVMNEEKFFTSMLEINVKGKRGKNTVLLKDSQWESIYDTAIHLDFLRVNSSDAVTVEVPVVALHHDTCPGAVQGGMLNLVRHALEVSCRADSIPEHIEIDCSKLEIGDIVHIDDVNLPEGATVQHDVNFTVLAMSAPKVEKEVVEDEGVAGTVEEETTTEE